MSRSIEFIACAVFVVALVVAFMTFNAPVLDSGTVVQLRYGRSLFGRPLYLIVVEGKTVDGRFAQHVFETDSSFDGYEVGDRWSREF